MRNLGFKFIFAAAMAVSMTSCDSCGGDGKSDLCDHVKASAANFKAGMQNTQNHFVVIDYRSADEFAKGHIPDAINIPVTNKDLDGVQGNCPYVKMVTEEADLNSEIFVYGADKGWGINGNAVPGQLACKYGSDKVTLLDGGYDAWVKAGYPTEQ